MAITGAHVLLYTTKPDELRAVLRDIFEWKYVDAGDGWLIFRLPPAELGIHPIENDDEEPENAHQFTLMCDNIQTTVQELQKKGIEILGAPEEQGWGVTVMLNLPGDVRVMLYQPKHPVAINS
jgi:predicted enzyme related to lactoylglutathione lyase